MSARRREAGRLRLLRQSDEVAPLRLDAGADVRPAFFHLVAAPRIGGRGRSAISRGGVEDAPVESPDARAAAEVEVAVADADPLLAGACILGEGRGGGRCAE